MAGNDAAINAARDDMRYSSGGTAAVIAAIRGGNSGSLPSAGLSSSYSSGTSDAAMSGALAGMNDLAAQMKIAAAQQETFRNQVLPQLTAGANKMFGAGDEFLPYAKQFLDRSGKYVPVEDKLIGDAVAGRESQAEGMAGQAGADVHQKYANSRDDIMQQLMAKGIMPGSTAWTSALRGSGNDEAANAAGAISRVRRDETKEAWKDSNQLRLGVMGLGNQVAGVGADMAKTAGGMYGTGGQLLTTAGGLHGASMDAYGNALKGYGAVAQAGSSIKAAEIAAQSKQEDARLAAYGLLSKAQNPDMAHSIAGEFGLRDPTSNQVWSDYSSIGGPTTFRQWWGNDGSNRAPTT